MAFTLEQYYNTGDDNATSPAGALWNCQTFTTVGTFTLTKVSLKLYRAGGTGDWGTLTVGIRATSGGQPTGSDLASATMDANSLTTDTAGAWYNFTFSLSLSASTKYAIVVRNNQNKTWYWRCDQSSPSYSGGSLCTSGDSGSSWTTYTGYDQMFETYSGTDVTYEDMAATAGGTGGGTAAMLAGAVVDCSTSSGGTGGGSAFLLSHVWLDDFHQSDRLVSAGNDQIWFEDTDVAAGTLVELIAARDDIDTSDQLVLFPLLEKVFVVNGSTQKVIDFGNVKITTANVGANPPDRENILTGGTSGAQMVVDYITTTSGACAIYGKRTTTATFADAETVTGIDDDSNPISFTLNADEDSGATEAGGQPHWYDWKPYGNDTTAYGTLPDKAYLGCAYQGRAVLSGNPDYPFQWYMSRQGNPFDFNYAATDVQRAVAGGTGNLGELGDMCRALIPSKDDALAFGCANSFIVLRGNPADDGYMENIDTKTGVYGQDAWCFDSNGDLYFWGPGGVHKSTRGFGQLQNLTAQVYPNIVDDESAGPATHRVVFGYDPKQNGIQISVTKLSDGSNSCYWYDMNTGGFYPDTFDDNHGAYSMLFYDANDPEYKHLLVGCTDGYIRRFDATSKNDDGLAIDSYVDYGPIQLSNEPDHEGVVYSIEAELGGGNSGGVETDSNNVTWRLWVERAADSINEKLNANTLPNIGGTFKGPGRVKGTAVKRKVKGVYTGIKLRNSALGESWGFEKMIVGIRPAGRAK